VGHDCDICHGICGAHVRSVVKAFHNMGVVLPAAAAAAAAVDRVESWLNQATIVLVANSSSTLLISCRAYQSSATLAAAAAS
jgi:hypothetical protein